VPPSDPTNNKIRSSLLFIRKLTKNNLSYSGSALEEKENGTGGMAVKLL